LQERSYRSFPPYDDWWSEGQFDSSQESVALAIQEYLYHFPDSLDADRLRWQLAFIDSIMFEDLKGNESYDDWMIEQLQSRLNQNGVLPSDLESVLDKYWFEVDYFQPIENLFGDGKTAWFYVVSLKCGRMKKIIKSPQIIFIGVVYFSSFVKWHLVDSNSIFWTMLGVSQTAPVLCLRFRILTKTVFLKLH